MKLKNKNFIRSKIFHIHSEYGGMLIELLLSVALAAVAMPFLFQYQENAVRRAENIVITQQMSQIQTALERYIVENRAELINTVGRNIVRLEIADLAPYGLSDAILESGDKYQLRILKATEIGDRATLQGVIVMATDDINALRTREIVSMGGGDMGFIEGNRAYGTFGTWHTNTADLGVNITDGIVEKTSVNRDNIAYLWRVPSNDVADATMRSALNLGGHDIENTLNLAAANIQTQEVLKLGTIATSNMIFQNRTTIDSEYKTSTATVSGALSSDARGMDVSGTLLIPDIAKFSSITTNDLWVSNLSLSGLSISSDAKMPILKVNQSLDMTAGRVTAIYATVGFSGSVTPQLVVGKRIEDSVNSAYYWDASSRRANLVDATLMELNRMAPIASYRSNARDTIVYQTFNSVSANKNATVAEYMNAINEIGRQVRNKYRQLNLE